MLEISIRLSFEFERLLATCSTWLVYDTAHGYIDVANPTPAVNVVLTERYKQWFYEPTTCRRMMIHPAQGRTVQLRPAVVCLAQ